MSMQSTPPTHTTPFFLAQAGAKPQPVRPPPDFHNPLMTPEAGIVLAVALAVAAALVFWAVFIRKRRHPDRHARVIDAGFLASNNASDPSGEDGHRHRHHRRRRSHEFKRNPTLQETGGLPPPRPEDEPPRG